MSELKLTLDWQDELFKGDTLRFPVKVRDTDISAWKIRASLTDSAGTVIDFATANVTGGGDDEILIEDGEPADEFVVIVAKTLTQCFESDCTIEIEREIASGELKTILKKRIYLRDTNIDWTSK